MAWTRWQAIEIPCACSGPAVYQIRLVRQAGNPCQIPRFLGIDDCGILSIGHSGNMDARRRQFVRALKCGTGHSGGDLLFVLLSVAPLKRIFEDHSIQFRFSKRPHKESAIESESKIIEKYVRQFGEAPPLCGVIPGYRKYSIKL